MLAHAAVAMLRLADEGREGEEEECDETQS